MLSPETTAAVRHGLDVKLLTEACDLDPAALNAWLDSTPDSHYASALRVHAHLVSSRNTIPARTAA